MRVAPRAFHVSLSFLSCLPLWSVSGVLWGAAFTGRSTETRSAPRRRAVVGGASARVLRRSAQQNPYDVLGLSRSSNYDDIRAAFRKLARTYHPDVPGTGDEDRFRSIREALEELGTEAGRARWSTSSYSSGRAQRSYNDFSYSGSSDYSYGASYSYSSDYSSYREDPFETAQRARRADARWNDADRESRRQKKKEEANKKKAQGAQAQELVMQQELKKAVKDAKSRQVLRRQAWHKKMKVARDAFRRDMEKEISNAWQRLHGFKEAQWQRGTDQVAKWKDQLQVAKRATEKQRQEDGETWVQRFAEVQQQAADEAEERGRRYSERWRDLRDDLASQSQDETPAKINQEIEDLLNQHDERLSERWSKTYQEMMKEFQRSMNSEPKMWKDSFRSAMIRLGKGGQRIQKRWLDLFHSTMQDMGDQEMKEVKDWVAQFKDLRSLTTKELKNRAKLVDAGRRLRPTDFRCQKSILQTIDKCRAEEMQRLKWQAWNRKNWVKKFRQEQDRLYRRQQEEELKLAEEFWEEVKKSHLQEAQS
ncbi:unnamed protein product [Durusdinium trenchii]|uniref:J domain-containing protein n=1 Tax=Durusdinium trenchii TaxID=1381693 RepID=A0ABP0NWE6_9DINO